MQQIDDAVRQMNEGTTGAPLDGAWRHVATFSRPSLPLVAFVAGAPTAVAGGLRGDKPAAIVR